MEYQIIFANAEIGQIEVLYKENNVGVAAYAIDVPIVDGAFLTGAELDVEIQHRAPVWLGIRKQELANATGFDKISALVQPITKQDAPEVDPSKAANTAMWAQVEYEKKLAAALVKFKVLSADPTTIEVSIL